MCPDCESAVLHTHEATQTASSLNVWLNRNGYANVDEWAQDSDYAYNADRGEWYDADDNWVDIEEMCEEAKAEATEIAPNGHQRECAFTILRGEQPIPGSERGDGSEHICDCGANAG